MSARTMKIRRHGVVVGAVDLATAELRSPDTSLLALWRKWRTDGFRVLGPPPEPPRPGMLADSVYTVYPAPDNLGLVALELENNGYRLEFEYPRVEE